MAEPMEHGARCLEEETILRFVTGRLRDDELDVVETHARECPSCDELLAAAFSPQTGDGGLGRSAIGSAARIGRYTVLELLGIGGMSEVYAAYDPALDRKIALKVLRPGPAARDHTLLVDEAQALARLSHPNVLRVHDVGWSGARVFIAMEYVDGVTLSTWLAEQRRSWREILAPFLAAARGLGAVHAAGLVHRDFKPQNVMVGRDGVVRVMDFGLARRIEDVAAEPLLETETTARSRSESGSDPTVVGEKNGKSVAGTPLFMSPEQLRGEVPDARSDQFSFCVSLCLAFYGRHPFLGGDALAVPATAPESGGLVRPDGGIEVPTQIWKAIARGLSARPEERWPSMDDLIAALEHTPIRRRRWRLAMVLGMGLAAAVVGLALGGIGRHRARLCNEGAAQIDDAWNLAGHSDARASRRARVREAFLGTGLAAATDIWNRVAGLLDRYRSSWVASQRDACEASLLEGRQPLDVMHLRMACLDTRRVALDALTNLFAAADRVTVNRAVDAIRDLPDLDSCAAVAQLRAAGGTAMSPELERRTTALRHRALSARAMFSVGDHKTALRLEDELLAEVRALGEPAFLAETLLMMGEQLDYMPVRQQQLREAVRLSLQVKRDDIAAEAFTVLVGVTGLDPERFEESEMSAELAAALQDRAGLSQGRLGAWLLNDRAIALAMVGRSEEARPLYEEALALKEKILMPDDPDLARTLNNQADNLHELGRDEEALLVNERAHRLFLAAYGPESVFVAVCLSNRGEYLLALGRAADALPDLFKSLDVLEDLGSDYSLAGPLTTLGRALFVVGRTSEARTHLERALELQEGRDAEPVSKADTEFALAEVLWAKGERTRAWRLAEAARNGYRAHPRSAHQASLVETWLSDRAT